MCLADIDTPLACFGTGDRSKLGRILRFAFSGVTTACLMLIEESLIPTETLPTTNVAVAVVTVLLVCCVTKAVEQRNKIVSNLV